jgi:Na+/proline symporter
MSTADAFLNIGVAALVHDVPRALRGRAPRRELWWARVGTVGLALVAAGFALYSHYANARLVALLGVFGAATFAAALVPVVSLGFNWKRATATAANWAIAASLAINLGIEVFGVRLPYGIHGGVVAMIVSLLLFLGISLASRPPALPPDIEAALDA